MDFNFSLSDATESLKTSLAAFRQWEGFLAVGTNEKELVLIRSLEKSFVAAYGVHKGNPIIATFLILLMGFFVEFLTTDTSLGIWEEIAFSVAQISLFYAELPVVLWIFSMAIWYFYSEHNELLLDCYVVSTVFISIWKKYSTRLHELCSLICQLYITNFILDLFLKITTSTPENLILYYFPLMFYTSISTDLGSHAIPNIYMIFWMMAKISKFNISSAPVVKYFELYPEDTEVHLIGDIRNRKAFLLFDGNSHYAVPYILLFFKSFIAGYASKNVVGVFNTILMMVVNWFLTFFDENMEMVTSGLTRLTASSVCQSFIGRQNYNSLAYGWITWYIASFENDHFHFFLDAFLILSALLYILKAYEMNLNKMSPLICFLYLVQWFSDECIGKPQKWLITISTLYVPVMIISTFSAQNVTIFRRLLFIASYTLLWFVLKHELLSNELNVYKFY